jgi:excisionase family DNA binding protein
MVSMDVITNPRSDTATTGAVLLDKDELAARLGVSERFVRRLVEERRIPYLKIGRFVRFDPVDIDRWLTPQRVEPRPTFTLPRRRR